MKNILDSQSKVKPVLRIIYGRDKDQKPNDYCIWDDYFGHWIENDSHFKNRILEKIKKG